MFFPGIKTLGLDEKQGGVLNNKRVKRGTEVVFGEEESMVVNKFSLNI